MSWEWGDRRQASNTLKYGFHSIIPAMVTSNIDVFLELQYSEPVCKEFCRARSLFLFFISLVGKEGERRCGDKTAQKWSWCKTDQYFWEMPCL